MKSAKRVRSEFIDFFQSKDHKFVYSSPVVPMEDPTLLFTNAGMNQFKDVFLAIGSRSYRRAVNSQKCIRVSGKHNDLEEVGHDTYHHTFFEMLGNWSFGDYYKKEAIQWAWELLTEIWKLPKANLWATVYQDDDESEIFWKDETDINPRQILRFGESDNFWEMGETGPCGPCSEIHIDRGFEYCDKSHIKNHICRVNSGCGRYIELWNLVFIQYNRDHQGKLHLLPSKHVDTGMGFERIVAVLQKVKSNYDTDLFTPILDKIAEITSIDYLNSTDSHQVVFRVIADHIRMLTFAIGDGAIPGNEGRGYVLRRILRRASRYARKLDFHDPFIYRLVPVVVDIMADAFPEIKDKQTHIRDVVKSEEEHFNKTLDRGIEIFGNIAQQLKKNGEQLISGKDAFRLYDTYGFPLDLTRIIAAEYDLTVDEEGFDREMEKQREKARNAGKFSVKFDQVDVWNVLKHCSSSSVFMGYEKLELMTEVCKFAKKDDSYQLVLMETPFYAEGGGQVADVGKIIADENELEVIDVQRAGNEIIHVCKGPESLNLIHSRVFAKVAADQRFPTMYNHTSTHLLHEALRRVLGKHVQQAGSMVSPERLRFDFTHFKKIEPDEIIEIERIVNDEIRKDHSLDIFYTDFSKAKEMGVTALFGEKYGEQVRVVVINNFSRELCGGTHVIHTGQIGSFLILQDSSIASGVRRIEAVTGPRAIEFSQKARDILFEAGHTLNIGFEDLPNKIKGLLDQIRENEKRMQKFQSEQAVHQVSDLIKSAEKIGNVFCAVRKFQNIDVESLKEMADDFRQKASSSILLLISQGGDKINFVCAVTDDLLKRGFHAGNLVKDVAKVTEGGGGGRSHLATAGGKNQTKIPDAIAYFKKLIEEKIH